MNEMIFLQHPSCLPDIEFPIRVGIWNVYESLTQDGFCFKNYHAGNGHNLLKPLCDLYSFGQSVGLQFFTLDQIDPGKLDAVIFIDRPLPGRPLADAVMCSSAVKYLIMCESPLIKPDNYDLEFRNKFDRVFTWDDTLVDGKRCLKLNYVCDPKPIHNFISLKNDFKNRKLCTIIAGAKTSKNSNELYSHRVHTIRWFESSAPAEFDLYGIGWDARSFPSYRGTVENKLEVLSRYKFSICYENAMNFSGYITEKILDCFLAGSVPIYGGAPNIADWIPADCYVDISRFSTYHELYNFMTSMDSDTHASYLDRISDFLSSPQFYPFSIDCYINTLASVVSHDVRKKRGDFNGVSLIQHRKDLAIQIISDETIR